MFGWSIIHHERTDIGNKTTVGCWDVGELVAQSLLLEGALETHLNMGRRMSQVYIASVVNHLLQKVVDVSSSKELLGLVPTSSSRACEVVQKDIEQCRITLYAVQLQIVVVIFVIIMRCHYVFLLCLLSLLLVQFSALVVCLFYPILIYVHLSLLQLYLLTILSYWQLFSFPSLSLL